MTDDGENIQLANNRFNISLSAPCMDVVNRIIGSNNLFNGRADFVFSAIRYFYIECNSIFRDVLEKAEEMNGSDTAYFLFSNSVRKFADEQEEIFKEKYPGPLNKQIPIRPSAAFYMNMCGLCQDIFGDTNNNSMQILCRIAIMRYIDYYRDVSLKNCNFVSRLGELKSKANKKIIAVDSGNTNNDRS